MAQSFWEKLGWTAAQRAIDELFKKMKEKKEKPIPEPPKPTKPSSENKSHPWRICPRGQHWVVTHPMQVEVSEKYPTGTTLRDGHCHRNPSKHEIIRPIELQAIAEDHAAEASPKPTPYDCGIKNGNQYDDLIALWTQFWNETLKPTPYLDPDLVKALLFSESSSRKDIATPNKDPDVGFARGLIQITDGTRRILRDPKGEIRDFLIPLSESEATDPNLNLAAGIRWLHHKKEISCTYAQKEECLLGGGRHGLQRPYITDKEWRRGSSTHSK